MCAAAFQGSLMPVGCCRRVCCKRCAQEGAARHRQAADKGHAADLRHPIQCKPGCQNCLSDKHCSALGQHEMSAENIMTAHITKPHAVHSCECQIRGLSAALLTVSLSMEDPVININCHMLCNAATACMYSICGHVGLSRTCALMLLTLNNTQRNPDTNAKGFPAGQDQSKHHCWPVQPAS